ncbi:MAG: TRM11 family SAM-dependent methyltransferase [Patescibacteria group bacterium]
MSNYYFVLGSTPSLSFCELEAIFNKDQVVFRKLGSSVVEAELVSDEVATSYLGILGGTIKVLKGLQPITKASPELMLESVVDYLTNSSAKVEFGVGYFDQQIPRLELSDIKKSLRDRGVASRYFESSQFGLSAAIQLHQDQVIELGFVSDDQQLIMTRTLAVQDIDDWSKRDRSKPYADRKKGMLPPKVARIMVNLALAKLDKPSPVLYDPFCGSGTILMEAVLRGCQTVVGTDIDSVAIDGTDQNLQWLQTEYKQDFISLLSVADVSQVKLSGQVSEVDCIVTEPFLGKPKPNLKQVDNIFRGLEKLYLGAFNNWSRLLSDGGLVVVVLPLVKDGNQHHSFEKFIDKLGLRGYTREIGPVLYHRPQAVVERQIFVLRFNKTNKKS